MGKYITHRHRQQCGGSQRERGMRRGWRWANEGKVGMERDFTWGHGHVMQSADDVLLSCTLETGMVTGKFLVRKLVGHGRLEAKVKAHVS